MISHDRRFGNRIPMELLLNEYVQDKPYRALSVNISESGVYVNKVVGSLARRSRVVGLEFELPGTNELIWARGEVCYDTLDDCFHGQGIRFTGMPRVHHKLIRDYCIEMRRAQLGVLLEKIRRAGRC
jgi:PilZ domain-containing protein